ncbi:MAG: hypothetical protein NC078_12605, partial [Ruminococcus sp.]|nr:hypothetical protein [Ruminococcus sp.]
DLVRLVCDIIETSAPAIVRAVVVILEEIIYALGPLSVSLLDTADIIIVKLIELIDKDAPLLIDCVANIIMKILDRIADDMYLIIDCGMRIVTGLIQGIADNIDDVVKAAVDLVVNLINGIADKIDDIILAVINLVVKLIDGVADGIEACSDDLLPAIQHLVDAVIDGLIKGVTGAAGLVVDAFKEVGSMAIDGIKDLLGIHSPSKVMAELGGYTAEGFASGILSGSGDVEDSMEDLNGTVFSSAKEMLGDISDIFSEDTEFSPTIRPVVDMDDIEKSAKETAGLFSGSYYAKGNMTIDPKNANAAAQETSYAVGRLAERRNGGAVTGTDIGNIESTGKSISEKMESLLGRFDDFTETFSHMQMVMDNGALIGQISSGLDRSLGTTASMKKRGV